MGGGWALWGGRSKKPQEFAGTDFILVRRESWRLSSVGGGHRPSSNLPFFALGGTQLLVLSGTLSSASRAQLAGWEEKSIMSCNMDKSKEVGSSARAEWRLGPAKLGVGRGGKRRGVSFWVPGDVGNWP